MNDTIKEKKEILFYYESRQNPNSDPGFDNQPRMMPNGTIMVTDVRIKRTMHDYAKKTWNEKLFVDFGEDGNPIKADQRAKEIIKNQGSKTKELEGDSIESLLKLTFDVPLFGALVTLRSGNDNEGGDSQKLTGPLQFGIGQSVNQVQVINPLISARFVGKEKKGKQQQFSTFGRFYSVEYVLIKVHGALNLENLAKYPEEPKLKSKFTECSSKIFYCFWSSPTQTLSIMIFQTLLMRERISRKGFLPLAHLHLT
jgi:CRISPR-associated protein Csh2